MRSVQQFAQEIRGVLAKSLPQGPGTYLDLAEEPELTLEKLHQDEGLPQDDPLAEAFFLILDALRTNRLDMAQIGINELWKAYLRWLTVANQEALSNQVTHRHKLIHDYCLEGEFPFTAQVWDYSTQVLAAVCHQLLERRLAAACHIILKTLGEMGRRAARKGLHTSSAQHFLRSLELNARQQGEESLADSARNQRFNLEVF